MDKNSNLGQILEQGQAVTKSTISDVAKSVKNQVVGEESSPDNSIQKSQQVSLTTGTNEDTLSAERTREVVKDFYAPSEPQSQANATPQNDNEKITKVREELQKAKQSAGELHRSVYYDPLFAYENKKSQEEERPSEKAEKEKMQDLEVDSKEKTKRDQDIAVQRAQTKTEMHPGVSG